jgi:hypothetical protein
VRGLAIPTARMAEAAFASLCAKRVETLTVRCGRVAPAPSYGLISAAISMKVVARMKTTLEIASSLLRDAKSVARRVRAFVGRVLQLVLSERRGGTRPFKLPDASVGGKGLHPDADGCSWEELRARSYDGRRG